MFSTDVIKAVDELCVALKNDFNRELRVHEINFDYDINRKFIRIYRSDIVSKSVWGFVDCSGNVIKARSWKSPSKTINGNIFIKKNWFWISSSSTW